MDAQGRAALLSRQQLVQTAQRQTAKWAVGEMDQLLTGHLGGWPPWCREGDTVGTTLTHVVLPDTLNLARITTCYNIVTRAASTMCDEVWSVGNVGPRQ